MSGEITLTGRSIYSREGIVLTIQGDRVGRLEACAVGPDAPYISPGFLDMQVNGYAGMDYNAPRLEGSHIRRIIALLAASGVTQHVPTFVTGSAQRIRAGLRALARELKGHPELAAAIPGVHVEGPYISEQDGPRGAHDPRYVRDPDYEEFLSWQEAAAERIKIITLAPERRGALEFIERVTRLGVVAAIGHTAAPPERIREAVEAGATLSTHLGNGSHGLMPRLHNYLWEQLAEDHLYAGIIADGFHLPPSVLKVFLRVKGLSRLILVSDAAVMGGKPPGVYQWGAVDVRVFEDGHLGLSGTEYLAGAGHLLDRGVAQFVLSTGCTLAEAVRLCTANPAALLGTEPPTEPAPTELAAGMAADLTQFRWEPGSTALVVEKTLLRGQLAYARDPRS